MPNKHNIHSPYTLISFGRSGTSLVSKIFANHPDFTSVNESGHLLFGVWKALEESKNVIPPTVENGKKLTEDERAARVVQQSFLTCFSDSKKYWFQKPIAFPKPVAEKFSAVHNDESKWNEVASWYWKVMLNCFPNSKFFTILRHPCDIAVSGKSYWGSNLTALWRQTALMGLLITHNDSPIKYALYYDKLINNPEHSVKDLFSYLNIPFKKEVLNAFKRVHAPANGRDDVSKLVSRRSEWNSLDPSEINKNDTKYILKLFQKFGRTIELPVGF